MSRPDKQVVAVVGRNLSRLRRSRALSVAEVAARSTRCEEELRAIEKGEKMPDHTTLLRLADALNVTLERIFDGLTLEPRAGSPAPAPVARRDGAGI